MCFVPEPEKVVAAVARALKPGGAFVIQEYANYEAADSLARFYSPVFVARKL